ncbi:hypothetical protein BT63DRAFT_417695 [Microthyrium microscopicum]|uniref:Uncharacterized protein n=1 Tax=Microthyrium microscopicum TaxID=703497 RepID=A0A6A6TZB1_9PEZI|nr:hypothetical protein BT63DRAFT_417695 [Microthyrium microscopicum]
MALASNGQSSGPICNQAAGTSAESRLASATPLPQSSPLQQVSAAYEHRLGKATREISRLQKELSATKALVAHNNLLPNSAHPPTMDSAYPQPPYFHHSTTIPPPFFNMDREMRDSSLAQGMDTGTPDTDPFGHNPYQDAVAATEKRAEQLALELGAAQEQIAEIEAEQEDAMAQAIESEAKYKEEKTLRLKVEAELAKLQADFALKETELEIWDGQLSNKSEDHSALLKKHAALEAHNRGMEDRYRALIQAARIVLSYPSITMFAGPQYGEFGQAVVNLGQMAGLQGMGQLPSPHTPQPQMSHFSGPNSPMVRPMFSGLPQDHLVHAAQMAHMGRSLTPYARPPTATFTPKLAPPPPGRRSSSRHSNSSQGHPLGSSKSQQSRPHDITMHP